MAVYIFPIEAATGAIRASFPLLVVAVLLGGCDPRLTPDQILAIERVEVAKAAYSRAFQPMLDSFNRCTDDSLAALKRCSEERMADRCVDRCKRTVKPGRERRDIERCVDRCMDDKSAWRLDAEICTKQGEDQSSCGKKFAAMPKPSSTEYDLAVRNCVEKGVASDYCTGKRKYKPIQRTYP